MTCKVPGTLLILILIACPAAALADGKYTEPTTEMNFVLIKGGCYQMGDSVGDGDPNERPVREVCLSDFYIGEYEVTNAQFKQFRPDHNSGRSNNQSLDADNMPVVNVSWEDAVAYSKWLSLKSGQNIQLPTEAQWEYAARAGSSQNRFWGNNPDEACKYANVADMSAKQHSPNWTTFYCDDKHVVSAPVGSYLPNGYGLKDVLGNVWEWCQDVYNSEAYTKLPQNDPVYLGSGEYRVMRGGGWSNGPLGVRSSHRVGLSPNFGHHALGIRLVRTAQ